MKKQSRRECYVFQEEALKDPPERSWPQQQDRQDHDGGEEPGAQISEK